MITVEVTLDELTNSQYWSGHGHSHAHDTLVGCICVGVPVLQADTVAEFVAATLAAFNAGEWDMVQNQYNEELDAVTDAQITEAIRDQIAEVEDTDRMFNIDEPFSEDVYFYAWIHVYDTCLGCIRMFCIDCEYAQID